MNDVAVAQALAARALAVSGPTGYAAIRNSFAFPQSAISAVPAIIILPDTDSVEYGGQTRRVTCTFKVRVYLEPVADLSRRFQMLHAYRTWLRNLYNGAVQLGGVVDMASVVNTDMSNDELGGDSYLTVEATVECVKQEAVAITA